MILTCTACFLLSSLKYYVSINLLDNPVNSRRTILAEILQDMPNLKSLNAAEVDSSMRWVACANKYGKTSSQVLALKLLIASGKEIPISKDNSGSLLWKEQLRFSRCPSCKVLLRAPETDEPRTKDSFQRCQTCDGLIVQPPKAIFPLDWSKVIEMNLSLAATLQTPVTRCFPRDKLETYLSLCSHVNSEYTQMKRMRQKSLHSTRGSPSDTKNVPSWKDITHQHMRQIVSKPIASWVFTRWNSAEEALPRRITPWQPANVEMATETVQRYFRGFLSRVCAQDRLSATVVIQSHIRGLRVRNQLRKVQSTDFEYIDGELDAILAGSEVENIEDDITQLHVNKAAWRPNRPCLIAPASSQAETVGLKQLCATTSSEHSSFSILRKNQLKPPNSKSAQQPVLDHVELSASKKQKNYHGIISPHNTNELYGNAAALEHSPPSQPSDNLSQGKKSQKEEAIMNDWGLQDKKVAQVSSYIVLLCLVVGYFIIFLFILDGYQAMLRRKQRMNRGRNKETQRRKRLDPLHRFDILMKRVPRGQSIER